MKGYQSGITNNGKHHTMWLNLLEPCSETGLKHYSTVRSNCVKHAKISEFPRIVILGCAPLNRGSSLSERQFKRVLQRSYFGCPDFKLFVLVKMMVASIPTKEKAASSK